MGLSDIRTLIFVTNFLIGTLFFYFINLVMMCIYKAKHPFFEQYRTTTRPWPWDEDPEAWNKKIKKVLLVMVFNTAITGPLISLLDIIPEKLPMSYDLASFPSAIEIILHLIVCMIVEDFCFYWSHRTLHSKFLYKHIHKKHHEFVVPVSIASHYAHPLEFIFGNVLPYGMGPLILGTKMHFFTRICWGILRLTETANGHSGYEFPWAPFTLMPFSGSAQYHGYHHTTNLGNYSTFFTVWDTVFGTNKHYLKYMANKSKKEAQKKQE